MNYIYKYTISLLCFAALIAIVVFSDCEDRTPEESADPAFEREIETPDRKTDAEAVREEREAVDEKNAPDGDRDLDVTDDADITAESEVIMEEDSEETQKETSGLVAEHVTEEAYSDLPDGFPATLRWQIVSLNRELVSKSTVEEGDEIILNLFADTQYVAEIDRVAENIMGTVTLRGRIKGYPQGHVIISDSGDSLLANITLPEENKMYRIVSAPDENNYYVLDLDPEKRDVIQPGPPLIPPTQD